MRLVSPASHPAGSPHRQESLRGTLPWLARAWRTLIHPRGDRRWDVFLRATAAAALLGMLTALVVPNSVTLVWLAVLALPANSPLSPVLPTLFEPLILEAAKHAAVIPVTLVATAAYMYMEYLNWHVYGWALTWDRLAHLERRRGVRWGVREFGRRPFVTVAVFAFLPLPFFVVRALALLHGYATARFMGATVLGRLPRFLAYAWSGDLLRIPTVVLVGLGVVATALVLGGRLLRREPLLVAELDRRAEGDAPPRPLAAARSAHPEWADA